MSLMALRQSAQISYRPKGAADEPPPAAQRLRHHAADALGRRWREREPAPPNDAFIACFGKDACSASLSPTCRMKDHSPSSSDIRNCYAKIARFQMLSESSKNEGIAELAASPLLIGQIFSVILSLLIDVTFVCKSEVENVEFYFRR
jgi:hypothetical protein